MVRAERWASLRSTALGPGLLYPERPTRSGRPTARGAAVAGGWLIVAVVLALYRTTPHPWRSWWAEDGAVFYSDAMRYSFPTTLHLVYNGYLQTISRPVAEVATWFPLSDGPLAMAVLTDVVIAALSIYVWRASRSIFSGWWAPALLAALVVVIPQAGFETTSSAADLHWYLDYASLWAVWRPLTTRSTVATSTALVLLAMLSDPLAILLVLPGVIGVIASPADRRRRLVVMAGLAVGAVIQVVASLNSHPFRPGPLSLAAITKFFIVRVVEAVIVGERAVPGVYDHTGVAVGAVCTVAVVVVGAWSLHRIGWRASVAPVVCLAMGVLMVGLILRLRGGIAPLGSTYSFDGSRYTLVPALLLWTAGCLVVDRLVAQNRPARQHRRPWPAVGLVLVATTVVANWHTPNVHIGAPHWSTQLAEAARRCRLSPEQRPPPIPTLVGDVNAPRRQPGPGDVTFYIAPIIGRFHNFTIMVPCNRL